MVSLQGWRVNEELLRSDYASSLQKPRRAKDEPGYIFELAACKTLASSAGLGSALISC